jgi:hypothetical protein
MWASIILGFDKPILRLFSRSNSIFRSSVSVLLLSTKEELMQTKTLAQGKTATVPIVETPPRRREAATKTAPLQASKPKVGKVTAASASTSKAKAQSSKRVKYSFSMPRLNMMPLWH